MDGSLGINSGMTGDLLQDILTHATDRRYSYFQQGARHYIVCNLTSNDDAMVLSTLVEAMHNNATLTGLVENFDYRWESASMISFMSQQRAAMFYVALTGDTGFR